MEATILGRLMGLRRVLVVVAAVALLAVMSLALAPGSARAGGIPNYSGAAPMSGKPVDGGEMPAEPVYALPPCYVEFGSNV